MMIESKSWRKRVGVEPTPEPAKDTGNGFEGHEDHRAPFASAQEYRVRAGGFQLRGTDAAANFFRVSSISFGLVQTS